MDKDNNDLCHVPANSNKFIKIKIIIRFNPKRWRMHNIITKNATAKAMFLHPFFLILHEKSTEQTETWDKSSTTSSYNCSSIVNSFYDS